MMFDAESQTCDLLRRAMHAANEKDDGRGLPLEAELIAEIIFLRRLNRDGSAMAICLAEMLSGERETDDFIVRSAMAQLNRIRMDWDYAPVIDAPADFSEFGDVVAA